MSLIIAIVLIVILLVGVGNDKARSAEYERNKKREETAIAEWEKFYISKDLEYRLRRCISDERNYKEVCDEIFPVLSGMKYNQHLIGSHFYLNEGQLPARNYKRAHEEMVKNQTLALDIMLANRGKVSQSAFWNGYNAHMTDSYIPLKEKAFEHVETILGLIRAHSPQAELCYRDIPCYGKYVWIGSPADIYNSRYATIKFDREVLFKENPIPPVK